MNQTENERIKYSYKYDKNIPGYILVPTCKNISQNTFPVLYLFHGTGGVKEWFMSEKANLFDLEAPEQECNLQKWVNDNGLSPMIVVTPEIDVSNPELQSTNFKGFSHRIPAIIDHVNQTYANCVRIGQENTAIAGFSMGGAAALYYVQKNEGKFYHFGSFSPSIKLYSWLPEGLTLPSLSGSGNVIGRGECEDSTFKKTVKQCVDEMKKTSVPILNGDAIIIAGAGHDFNTFNSLLKKFILQDVFKKKMDLTCCSMK